jgi:hypothetical protein
VAIEDSKKIAGDYLGKILEQIEDDMSRGMI